MKQDEFGYRVSDRELAKARRAVEKAAHLLRRIDD